MEASERFIVKVAGKKLWPTGHLRFVQRQDGLRYLQNLYRDLTAQTETYIWIDVPLEVEHAPKAKSVDGNRSGDAGGDSDGELPEAVERPSDAGDAPGNTTRH